MTVPDGMPRITSAAKFGPDSTARRLALPISASNTSTGSRPLPSSTPFEQTTMGRRGSASGTRPTRTSSEQDGMAGLARASASTPATSRMTLDGVTMTAACAPAKASS